MVDPRIQQKESYNTNKLVSIAKSVGVLASMTYAATKTAMMFQGGYTEMMNKISQTKAARDEAVQLTRLFKSSVEEQPYERLNSHKYEMRNALYQQRMKVAQMESTISQTIEPDTRDEMTKTLEKERDKLGLGFADDTFYHAASLEEQAAQFRMPGNIKFDPNDVHDVSGAGQKLKEFMNEGLQKANRRMEFMRTDKELAEHSTPLRAARQLQKEYGPIVGWMKQAQIDVSQIRQVAHGYEISIAMKGTTAKITLPSFKNGIIKWGTSDYIPVQTAVLFEAVNGSQFAKAGETVLLAQDFGLSVIRDVQRTMDMTARMESAQEFANTVHRIVHNQLQGGENLRGSKFAGTSQMKLRLAEAAEDIKIPGSTQGRRLASEYARIVQGMSVYHLTAEGLMGEKFLPQDTGMKVDILATSATSMVGGQKFVATRSGPLDETLFQTRGKDSTVRQNMMRGRTRAVDWTEEYYHEQVIRHSGNLNEEQLYRYGLTNEVPSGGIAGTMYWFGNDGKGYINGIYEGGSLVVAQDSRDLNARIATIKQNAKDRGNRLTPQQTAEVKKWRADHNIPEKKKGNYRFTKAEEEELFYLRKRLDTTLHENIMTKLKGSVPTTYRVKWMVEDATSGKTFMLPKTTEIVEKMTGTKFDAETKTFKEVAGSPRIQLHLKPGEVLGVDVETGQNITVPHKAHWVIDQATLNHDGQVTFKVLQDYTPGVGSMKDMTHKAVLQRIATAEEAVKALRGGAEGVEDAIFRGDVVNAPSQILSGDMLKRLEGGGVGRAFTQKVLSDVAGLTHAQLQRKGLRYGSTAYNEAIKDLKQTLRTITADMIGPEAAALISDFHVAKDGMVSILWRGNTSMTDTRLMGFKSISDKIEEAISTRNVTKLGEYAKDLEKKVQGITKLENFHIVGYQRQALKMASQASALLRNAPALLFSNKTASAYLGALNLNVHEFIHLESSNRYTAFANTGRGLNGYSGGFKLTVDHIVNADNMGLKHYSRFLSGLLDYNLPYLEDKLESTGRFVSAMDVEKQGKSNPVWGKSGRKRMKTIAVEDFGEDLRSRMADDYARTVQTSSAVRFRVTEGNIRSLVHHLDDDAVESIASMNALSLDDLDSFNRIGIKGHTVRRTGLYGRDVVDRMMEIMNTAKPDEALYMRLPKEVTIGGQKVQYVPMHKIDREDMVGLVSDELVDAQKNPAHLRTGQTYYTGSSFVREQMDFVQEIMEIQDEMRKQEKNEEVMASLDARLQYAVEARTRNLRLAFTGKHSPYKTRMFEISAPLSGKGVVMGAMGVPDHLAALHPDDMVKFITGNQVQGVRHAERLAAEAESLAKTKSALKKIVEWKYNPERVDDIKALIETEFPAAFPSSPVLSEQTKNLRKNIDDFVTAHHRTADMSLKPNMISDASQQMVADMQTAARDILTNNGVKEAQEAVAVGAYAVDILKDLGMTYKDGHLVMPTSEAAYFEGGKVLKPIRAGLVGAMHRAPEASRWSAAGISFALHDNGRGISEAALKGKLGDVLRKGMTWSEGVVQVSQNTLKGMHGDVDKDLVSFIMKSYGYLEEKAQKATAALQMEDKGFSIVRKFQIPLGMDDLKAMQDEAIIQTVKDKLAFIGTENGKQVLKPANISSLSMIHGVRQFNDSIEKLQKTPLRDVVTQALEAAEGVKPGAKRVEQIVSSLLGEHYSMHGEKHVEAGDIFAITGYNQPVTPTTPEGVAAVKQAAKDAKKGNVKYQNEAAKAARALDDDLERGFQAIMSGDSFETTILRDKLHDNAKGALKKVQQEYFKETAQNFPRIKTNVATSYRFNSALRTLSEVYARDDRERAFIELLGADKIEQMALDAKHGAPDIIDDIESWFRRVASKTQVTTDADVQKLVHDKWITRVTAEEGKRIKAFGFATETAKGVPMDVLGKYRETRKVFLDEVVKVNEEADRRIADMFRDQKIAKDEVHTYRQKFIKGRLANSKVVRDAGMDLEKVMGTDGAHYHTRTAYLLKEFADREVKGIDRVKDSLFNKTFSDVNERRDLTKRLFGYMKRFETDFGRSIHEDEVMRSLSGFAVDETSLSMKDVMNRIHERVIARQGAGQSIYVRSAPEARMLKAITNTMGFDDVKAFTATLGAPRGMEEGLEISYRREIGQINREFSKRMEQQSTVFRRGSILEGIFGGINRATRTAETDTLLAAAQRSRVGAVVAGLFLGVVAGQTFNQITKGYPVPDLKSIAGLGGEYYEHNRGIIGSVVGRQMEIMMKPRDPRVVPMDRGVDSLSQDAQRMANLQLVLQNDDRRRKPGNNSYRGCVIS